MKISEYRQRISATVESFERDLKALTETRAWNGDAADAFDKSLSKLLSAIARQCSEDGIELVGRLHVQKLLLQDIFSQLDQNMYPGLPEAERHVKALLKIHDSQKLDDHQKRLSHNRSLKIALNAPSR